MYFFFWHRASFLIQNISEYIRSGEGSVFSHKADFYYLILFSVHWTYRKQWGILDESESTGCSHLVVVRIFNATRHARHIEAAAIVMYMYLYSLAFKDHSCLLCAAVCHQAPLCPFYTQPRARRVWARRANGLKIVSTRAGFKPTIFRLTV